MSKRAAWVVVKTVLSVALLAVVASRVDLALLARTLAHANWAWLAAAYSLTAVTLLLRAYKWRVLLSSQGVAVPFGTLSASCLVSMFFNSFLPMGVGGDVARAYDVSKYTSKTRETVSSVLWDRLTGMTALLLLAAIGWAAVGTGNALPPSSVWWVMVPLGLLAAVVWNPGMFDRSWLPGPLRAYVEAFERMASRRSVWLAVMAISLAVQAITVIFSYFAAKAVGIALPLAAFCMIIPVVTAVTMLPISVNGLGLREGAHIVLLTQWGVPASQALVLSLVTTGAVFLVAAAGGIAYLIRR